MLWLQKYESVCISLEFWKVRLRTEIVVFLLVFLKGGIIMHIQKRTYSIDKQVLNGFERSVASGNRSIVVTDLLRKYLADEERKSIRQALISGAGQMNDFYREESEEWLQIEEEANVEVSTKQPAPRRYRKSPVRSRQRA